MAEQAEQYTERSEAPHIDLDIHAHGFGLRVLDDDPAILLCQVVNLGGTQVCVHSRLTVKDADELIEGIQKAQAAARGVAERLASPQ